jgi:DNA-binding transcriptional MerR regulator
MKRAGGRRFYRRQDIDVLRGVRALLHDEGYTIKGVQRLHKEHGVRRLLEAAAAPDEALPDPAEGLEAEASTEPLPPEVAAAPPGPPEAADAGALDEEGPERDGPRPVLDLEARARLTAVLGHLEAVKARIDGLLGGGR